MLERKHIIAHRAEALPKGEFPLAEDRIEHHLSYLKSDLESFLEEKGIEVSVDIQNNEALITLKSQSDNVDLDNELASALREINRNTSGLALVKVG